MQTIKKIAPQAARNTIVRNQARNFGIRHSIQHLIHQEKIGFRASLVMAMMVSGYAYKHLKTCDLCHGKVYWHMEHNHNTK